MKSKTKPVEVGDIFGKLVVTDVWVEEKGKNNKKERVCKCNCECGSIDVIVDARNLRRDRRGSCGCINKQTGNKHHNWKGYGDISLYVWSNIIYGSTRRSRDILFDITIEYGWNLFLQQNGRCALSGVQLNFPENSKIKSKSTASLDRIDSSKGYIEGNVQWVHKHINVMKLELSQQEFINLCRNVRDFQLIKKEL